MINVGNIFKGTMETMALRGLTERPEVMAPPVFVELRGESDPREIMVKREEQVKPERPEILEYLVELVSRIHLIPLLIILR